MRQRFNKNPAGFLAALVLAVCAVAAAQLTPTVYAPAGAPGGTGQIGVIPVRSAAIGGVIGFLGQPNTVDLKSTGARQLYTSPTGKDTLITGVVFRVKNASSVSVAPVVGLGVASGEDDVLAPITLTGLSSGECLSFLGLGTGVIVTGGQTLSVGVDTGATATALDVDIILIGGFVPQ